VKQGEEWDGRQRAATTNIGEGGGLGFEVEEGTTLYTGEGEGWWIVVGWVGLPSVLREHSTNFFLIIVINTKILNRFKTL
jgi:hypothetical protein